jgi:hypothetical protein
MSKLSRRIFKILYIINFILLSLSAFATLMLLCCMDGNTTIVLKCLVVALSLDLITGSSFNLLTTILTEGNKYGEE